MLISRPNGTGSESGSSPRSGDVLGCTPQKECNDQDILAQFTSSTRTANNRPIIEIRFVAKHKAVKAAEDEELKLFLVAVFRLTAQVGQLFRFPTVLDDTIEHHHLVVGHLLHRPRDAANAVARLPASRERHPIGPEGGVVVHKNSGRIQMLRRSESD